VHRSTFVAVEVRTCSQEKNSQAKSIGIEEGLPLQSHA
jgi:hypothetical protein